AGRFELPALHLELPKQSSVVDREDGLGGEGLQELDDFLGEPSGLASPDNKAADDPNLEEQRHGEEGPTRRRNSPRSARRRSEREPAARPLFLLPPLQAAWELR